MNKQARRLIGLLACAGISIIDARTISTPLPLYHGYPAAHIYYPVDDMREINNCLDVDAQVWGAGYYRSANDAYGPGNDDCNPCVGSESAKQSIAALIFGTDHFTLSQAFANSTVGTSIPNNPFVSISTLSPDFTYRERGAFFGLILGKRFGCDDAWRAGVRIEVPYRDIDLAETACSDIVGETLEDVLRQRQETIVIAGIPRSPNTVWTARLDFLSALNSIAINAAGNPTPLVVYTDPNSSNLITIASQDITGALSSGDATTFAEQSAPPVAAIRSADGSVPESVRWADVPANGATVIAADGTGLSNLGRGRFVDDVNYTPLQASTSNQRELWISPNVNDTGFVDGTQDIIYNAIILASQDLDPNVTNFLKQKGINFCNGRTKGIGDVDFEFYVGHHCDCAFAELQLGVRVPTGRKLNDPRQLILQPGGNNGHVELRPGLVLGTSYFDWMRLKLDVTYSFVLKKTEILPASFTGATVRNIGTSVPGCVSWSYFLGDFDITFVNPCNPCMGVSVAYQPYVKKHDKICFECTEVVDFIGNVQTVDATILRADSKRIAHTIRTELFYNGDCYNLFLGFAQVVAGQNVTRDTDFYLGGFVTF